MWSDYLVKYVKIYNNDMVKKGELEKEEKEDEKIINGVDIECVCNLFENGESNSLKVV